MLHNSYQLKKNNKILKHVTRWLPFSLSSKCLGVSGGLKIWWSPFDGLPKQEYTVQYNLYLKREESLWRDPNLAGALFSPEDDLDWVSQNSYFIIFISVRSSLCKLTVSCFAEVTRQGLRLVAGQENESTADKENFWMFLLFANHWRPCFTLFQACLSICKLQSKRAWKCSYFTIK